MRKHLQPHSPVAPYARGSCDRQDVDLSVSAQTEVDVSGRFYDPY